MPSSPQLSTAAGSLLVVHALAGASRGQAAALTLLQATLAQGDTALTGELCRFVGRTGHEFSAGAATPGGGHAFAGGGGPSEDDGLLVRLFSKLGFTSAHPVSRPSMLATTVARMLADAGGRLLSRQALRPLAALVRATGPAAVPATRTTAVSGEEVARLLLAAEAQFDVGNVGTPGTPTTSNEATDGAAFAPPGGAPEPGPSSFSPAATPDSDVVVLLSAARTAGCVPLALALATRLERSDVVADLLKEAPAECVAAYWRALAEVEAANGRPRYADWRVRLGGPLMA